ncbi:MAG: DEAD/DEAH box helicase [Gracilibacteraceae bacterium]|nr:DEAD/DEAH box helicase [Gracilibacteraceae bacterium]
MNVKTVTKAVGGAPAGDKSEIVAICAEKGLLLDAARTDAKKRFYREELLGDFAKAPYKTLLYFGFTDKNPDMAVSLSFIHDICARFVFELTQDGELEFTRTPKPLAPEKIADILANTPFMIGAEYVDEDWLRALWAALTEAFAREIAEWDGTAEEFLLRHKSGLNVVGRIFFHLVENKSVEYPFAFLATYTTGDAKSKKADHLPLSNALIEHKDDHETLLRLMATVSKATERSDFISELTESGELFSPLRFTAAEAYTFLREAPVYEECGILCRIPNWWRRSGGSVRVAVSLGGKEPARVGLDAILDCSPAIFFGDDEITPEELTALLSQSAGLSLLKGKWVEVDREKIRLALEAYEKAAALGDMTLAEAMRFELGIEKAALPDELADIIQITNGQWLKNLREKLRAPGVRGAGSQADDAPPELGASFKASLRHYQQKGFQWLTTMKSMGFGALLADDMGLGKTVQILALLEYLRQNGGFKGLLILPASLIGNWQKEIEKFAPEIRYSVLHAGAAAITDEDHANTDLFITTYGMARRMEDLGKFRWDLLILDEAQAVKNPASQQTKAIKGLKSAFRVAMTGTPVENRLLDLWSIFDFLNAGFLGSMKEFTKYASEIKSAGTYAKLKEAISPFILRRLKTDKSIISDLPDKVEIKDYADLSRKQRALYAGLVDEIRAELEGSAGIKRKGLIIAAIMKFKQICNHPDHYLGLSEYKETHSGKFEKLREICEVISEKHEKVLVFTQFKEITERLAAYLTEIFGRPGLVIHGGTPVKKRTEYTERFNSAEYIPFMVLSLKAGGVGLNLTAANHVIHFDRWWNPAVENQATDRAFRIGQTKNVMVHKFITRGAIEEKIDEMIESKAELAKSLIESTGENWVTEMSDAELLNLFALERER